MVDVHIKYGQHFNFSIFVRMPCDSKAWAVDCSKPLLSTFFLLLDQYDVKRVDISNTIFSGTQLWLCSLQYLPHGVQMCLQASSNQKKHDFKATVSFRGGS